MRGISAGIAACAVAVVAGGCSSVQAPRTGAAAHPAASAQTGKPTTNPGVPAGARPGCPGAVPAGPAGTTVITLAGNGKAYCVRVGDTLRVDLRAPGSSAWLRPLVSGRALVPVKGAVPTRAPGVTSASFAAMRPGQVIMTSVRPPCHIAIGAKGGLEPAFPLPKAYPLRFCTPAHRFSVSVTVLR